VQVARSIILPASVVIGSWIGSWYGGSSGERIPRSSSLRLKITDIELQ
jgi:hypothetical protein